MAQLVLGVAGAAVGSLFGAPQVGWMIGSAIGGALQASQQKVSGPRLSDLKVTSTDYGQPIPWIAGTPRIAGQMWWASDRREIANSESAGKGGGPTVTTYTYEIDCLIGLTDNEIGWISRVWWNGKLVYNVTIDASDATKNASATSQYWRRLTVYPGSESQLPDPTYEAAIGTDLAPGYRGRGAVFIEGMQLGNSGQIPNLTFEIAISGAGGGEVVLLMQFDGDIGDAAGHAFEGVGDMPFVEGRFAQAIDINGVDSITSGTNVVRSATASSDWDLNDGDFTISGWIYVRSWYSRPITLISITDADGVEEEYAITADSIPPRWYGYYAAGPDSTEHFGPAGTMALNEWTYLELCRHGDTYYMFVNGELGTPGLPKTYRRPAGPKRVFIGNGQNFGGFDALIGCIDGLRIVRGKALHTEAYEVPDAPPGYGIAEATMTPLPSLQQTLEQLCARAGMSPDQYDASALATITKPVRALAATQAGPTRPILEQLQTAYFFEASLSDKLYFRPRALDPVMTIPFADLAAGVDEAEAEPLAITIASDLELPAQVAVEYSNMLDDQQKGTEYSDRLITGQASLTTMQLALGLNPGEAKGVADAIVADSAASLISSSISLPGLRYAKLESADVVTVIDEDGLSTYRMRLTKKSDEPGVLKFDAVLDDQTVVISAAITDESYVPSGEVSGLAGTELYPLDIPLLRDADNSPGYYVSARGETIYWPGASVLSSADDVSYSTAAAVDERAVMGSCATVLGNWTGLKVVDELNSVTVTLAAGELANISRETLLSTTDNTMLIGSEVIRFMAAELLSASPNVYRLTRLLRGQLGTEWAMTGHATSERAVLLQLRGLRRVAQESSEIGQLRYLKGVTYGTSAADVAAQPFTPQSISQKPYAPVDLRATEAAAGAMTVTWKRRTRLASRLVGPAGISVPLGESAEVYEVEVRDDYGVLVSTETVTAPQIALSKADRLRTYAEGVAAGIMVGADLVGVQVEGQGVRYMLRQNAAGAVVETSFALGDVVTDVTYDGTVAAYIVGYFQTATVPTYLINSLLTRVGLGDLSTFTARWDALPLGDAIYGAVFDGTNVWTVGNLTGTLRKHDAATLAVLSTISTGGSTAFKVAHHGGLLYVSGIDNTKVAAIDPAGSPTILWTTDLSRRCTDIVATADCVFVTNTQGGVVVLDVQTGAILQDYTDGVSVSTGTGSSLQVFGGQVVYARSTSGVTFVFRFLSGITGEIVDELLIPGATAPGGISNGNLLVFGSPTSNFTNYVGYEVAFTATVAGYTVTVYQISADVGRGYPATIQL